ncbi:MAG: tetratricopeptide repeat protein, partial [Planctomycetes bacterium]|nr:tetratricopeptide repeat protein [Planctomycetota bacterium]
QAYYRQKDYKDAEAEFEKAAEQDAANLDAILSLALINAQYLKSPADAKLALQKLLDRVDDEALGGSDRAQAAVRAAAFYAATGRGSDAEMFLQTAVSLQPDDPRYRISLGDFYKKRGRDKKSLSLAEKAYQKALEIAPADPSAFLSLGLFYKKNGQIDKAIEIFEKAVAASPAPVFYQHLIESLIDKADLQGARTRLGELRRISGTRDTADYLEGRILLTQAGGANETLRKAEKFFAHVAKVKPRFAEAHYYLGVCLATRGALEDAEMEFQRALSLSPNQTMASVALAETYFRAHQFDKAAAQARSVLERNGKDYDANLVVGKALMARGDLAAALGFLQAARSLRPVSAAPYIALAELHVRRDEYDDAVAILEDATRLTDNAERARMAMAMVRRRQGKTDEALRIASEIAAKDPQDTGAAGFYCSFLWRQGRAQDALDFLEGRLQKYPDNLGYINLLGDFRQSLGRHEEALSTYAKALQQAPADQGALAGAAESLVVLERFDQARARIKLLRDANADSPAGDLLEARILEREGKSDEAEALLSKTLRGNRANAEAYYRLAVIQQEKGELDKAIENLKSSLKYNPSSIMARLALAKAYYRTRFWEDALREARHIENAPQIAPTYISRAVRIATGSLMEARRTGEAINQWSKLPPEVKDSDDYMVTLGYLYMADEQFDKAEALFRKAAAELQEPAAALEGLAELLLSQERLDEAAAVAEQALSGHPAAAVRLRLLQIAASVALAGGRTDDALDAISKMLKAAGDNAALLVQVGDSFLALGEDDRAVETYRAAVEADGQFLQAQRRLVSALTAAGRPDEAKALVEKILRDNPDDFDSLVLKAQALLAEKRPRDASEVLSRALETRLAGGASRAAARYLLGKAQYESGFLPSAETDLRRALALDPALSDARLLLAEVLLRSHSYEEAAVEAREVIKTDPANATAYGLLADAAMLSDEPEKAVQYYRKALSIRKSPALIKALVALLAKRGETDEIIRELSAYVEAVPSQSAVAAMLAKIYETRKDYASAEGVLKRALEASPKNAALEALLAGVYTKESKMDEARSLLEAAVEDHPTPDAYRRLASLYAIEGHAANAEAMFRKGIELYPDFLPNYNDLAGLLASRNLPGRAVEVLKSAVAANSDKEAFYVALASFYLRLGMKRDREAFLKETARDHPDFAGVTCTLGDFYFERGDVDAALAAYERALEFSPDDPRAANGAAYMLIEKDTDLGRAVQLATRALSQSPKDPGILDTLGWARYKNRQYDRAVANLADAAELSQGKTPTILYHLALAYDKLGAESRAEETARRLVDADASYTNDQDIKVILARE